MAPKPVRVLLIAPRHPEPPLRGDQRRVLHFAEELGKRIELTLVCFGEEQAPAIEGVRTLSVARRPLAVLRANLAQRDPLLPMQIRAYLDSGLAALVSRELRERPPDVVHATLARTAPYLPPAGPWRRHLDLVDALSINMTTRASASRGVARLAFRAEAALMRRYEALCVAAAESSSVVSERDRLGAPGLERAAVIPNGVDSERFPYKDPSGRPRDLIFFGNLGYFHNIEPARFLAEEVMPLVRAEVPQARLKLVGARPGPSVRRLAQLDHVDLVGPVDDIAGHLHRAALAAIPRFSGSGMKNTVIEAFSAGTPVVANALGVAGVTGAREGIEYLRAESSVAFATACVELLDSASRRVALALPARGLIEEHYSWGAQAERLLDLYRVTAGESS